MGADIELADTRCRFHGVLILESPAAGPLQGRRRRESRASRRLALVRARDWLSQDTSARGRGQGDRCCKFAWMDRRSWWLLACRWLHRGGRQHRRALAALAAVEGVMNNLGNSLVENIHGSNSGR